MTITIDLSDDLSEHLCREAEEKGLTPQELVQRILEDWAERWLSFDETARRTLRKNAELYRRLAGG